MIKVAEKLAQWLNH